MWKIFGIIYLVISIIQQEADAANNTSTNSSTSPSIKQSYDEQVANEINRIDIVSTSIISAYNAELPAVQNLQSAVAVLGNSLPNSIVNEKLSYSFTVIEAIGNALRSTNEALCFNNFAQMKSSTLNQANITFASCTSALTAETNQLLSSIKTNIVSLNSTAKTAKTNLAACGSNKLYRLNEVLFKYCLKASTTTFNTLLAELTKYVTELQTRRTDGVNNITTCATTAFNKAETLVDGYNSYIKLCIATSSMASEFSPLLVTAKTNATDITDQVRSSTNTSSLLNTTKNEAASSFAEATTAVTAANNATSLTVAAAKAVLEAENIGVAAKFQEAADKYASNSLAATCVQNISVALRNNINKVSSQLATCVNYIPSSNLPSDLCTIQKTFDQLRDKGDLTVIQCISQVDNFVIADGIKGCREESESDDTTNYLFLKYKSMTLKEEANLVINAASRCNDIVRKYVARQNYKDKLSFETCILRNLQEVTTITLN